jgi:hypothetical protein
VGGAASSFKQAVSVQSILLEWRIWLSPPDAQVKAAGVPLRGDMRCTQRTSIVPVGACSPQRSAQFRQGSLGELMPSLLARAKLLARSGLIAPGYYVHKADLCQLATRPQRIRRGQSRDLGLAYKSGSSALLMGTSRVGASVVGRVLFSACGKKSVIGE